MKPTLEELITKAGGHDALTTLEREKMRATLRAYIASKPLIATAILSPYQRAYLLARRPMVALVAAVLVVGALSSGVAYAAEGTLPGDTLYPVKVDVIEPLQTALTFSAQAKAAWHTTLAERRIKEGTELAAQGKLNPMTEASLVANFNYNARAAGIEGASSTAFDEQLSVDEARLNYVSVERGDTAGIGLENAIQVQLSLLGASASSSASSTLSHTAVYASPLNRYAATFAATTSVLITATGTSEATATMQTSGTGSFHTGSAGGITPPALPPLPVPNTHL